MGARKFDWRPIELGRIKMSSLKERQSKVSVADFGHALPPRSSFGQFLDSLPSILAARELRKAVKAMAGAIRTENTVLLGMGAHPIKVGLNPVIIDAVERGFFSGIALNGAGIIHDVEIALAGKTSEDVAEHLACGRFGMAHETSEFIHRAVLKAYQGRGEGLGRAVGEALLMERAPYADASLLAAAARCDVPVTVHVALGTDIVHMHPEMDGAATGALSHFDFRLFCSLVSTLKDGIFINLGSAVIIPEVFLKAVSVAGNLGFRLDGLTAINMDFVRHYRPMTNVLQRPVMDGGSGINLTGHHEIMFPLLMAAVMEEIEKGDLMEQKILIRSGKIEMRGELNDSPTALALFKALPLSARANRWGEEIYFEVPVNQELDDKAAELVQAGDLGYWPSGRAFCIFFGPTPISRKDEIRPASAVNLVGKVTGDARAFKAVNDGDLIELDVVR